MWQTFFGYLLALQGIVLGKGLAISAKKSCI